MTAHTLADLYDDRDLTDAQIRRLVALLGLTRQNSTLTDTEPDDTTVRLPEAA